VKEPTRTAETAKSAEKTSRILGDLCVLPRLSVGLHDRPSGLPAAKNSAVAAARIVDPISDCVG